MTRQVAAIEPNRADQFDELLNQVRLKFETMTEGGVPLFTTDATGLYERFLEALPSEIRQTHTCNACRHFVDRFGGLVTISETGVTTPALWPDDPPTLFASAVNYLWAAVRRASVTGVFLSKERILGTSFSEKSKKDIELGRGPWSHFSVANPQPYAGLIQNAGQAMAEKRAEYEMLSRALGEFKQEHMDQAVALLCGDALYRSEKVLGAAEWLRDLKRRSSLAGASRRRTLIWLAVATAPSGFCHPRSSMIGTLLEDLEAGMPVEDVQRRFAAKMHPLQYQRPQAAPAAGNIEAAEKVVAKLGIANSLKRRFARLEEVEAVWKPTEPKEAKANGGVFGHLVPKGEQKETADFVVPAQTMTWVKFRDTVLPDAQQIELSVPNGRSDFAALVTAVDPNAPPIIQWDRQERRNPVSWYRWMSGSTPAQWGISPGFCKVTAITLSPAHWYGNEALTQPNGIILLLEGAKDSAKAGLALFPEILKSELHGIRSTIEAYSKAGELEGMEEATACGVVFNEMAGGTWGKWKCLLRVTGKDGMRAEYILDRWD